MRYNNITVQAGRGDSEELHRRGGWDIVDENIDTVAVAKRKARHYLTDEFAVSCEMSEPFTYSQVVADGEVIHDFFKK